MCFGPHPGETENFTFLSATFTTYMYKGDFKASLVSPECHGYNAFSYE